MKSSYMFGLVSFCTACFLLTSFSINNKDLNKKQSFSELLKKYEGKVIYLDLWASWCKPCREEIKKTKKLKSIYKDEDIAFVYLTVDLDKEQCEKAIKKDGVIAIEDNYYITEIIKDSLYKKLELKGVLPYYVIIGKDGTIHTNAPRPSEKEKLRKELDTYLEE